MNYSKKYKLKDTYVKLFLGDTVQLGDEPGYSCEIEDETGFFKDLIPLLNGEYTIYDIKSGLEEKYPEVTEEYLLEVIKELDNSLLIAEQQTALFADDRHRSNLNFFENFSSLEVSSEVLLNRIRDLRVGIVGLGGLGSNILTQLAGLGCKEIHVIEPDCVEEKNLNRQFLYKTEDIGLRKATAAKKNIFSLNPDVNVHTNILHVSSTQDLLDHFPEDLDLLICAADQPLLKIQLWCNQYCLINQIPFISGGLGCSQGHFLTVIPERTPCLECFYSNLLKDQKVKETLLQIMKFDNKNAAIGNSINLIASSIITEILRLFVLKIDPVSLGRRVFIDFLNLTYINEDNWTKEMSCSCNSGLKEPTATLLEKLEGDIVEV